MTRTTRCTPLARAAADRRRGDESGLVVLFVGGWLTATAAGRPTGGGYFRNPRWAGRESGTSAGVVRPARTRPNPASGRLAPPRAGHRSGRRTGRPTAPGRPDHTPPPPTTPAQTTPPATESAPATFRSSGGTITATCTGNHGHDHVMASGARLHRDLGGPSGRRPRPTSTSDATRADHHDGDLCRRAATGDHPPGVRNRLVRPDGRLRVGPRWLRIKRVKPASCRVSVDS